MTDRTTTVDLELGVDSLCWNRQIAQGMVTLEDVVSFGRELGAGWLRLHHNHLGRDADDDALEVIGRRAVDGGQQIIWSGDGLGRAVDGVDRGVAHVRAEIAKAARAGATFVQFYASWFRYDMDVVAGGVDRELDYIVEVLRTVAPDVREAGLILGLENHSNVKSDEMVEIMERVDDAAVRVYLDVANAFPVSEEILPSVERLAPYTVAIDVKDIRVESRWASEAWHRRGYEVIYTWPGKGFIPWQDVWHVLGASLPTSPVPLVMEGLDEADDPFASASQAARFMEGLEGPRLRMIGDGT